MINRLQHIQCEGYLPGEHKLRDFSEKKLPYIEKQQHFPVDAASTFITRNGSIHFWILGGRYLNGYDPDGRPIFKPTRQTIFIKLDEWKQTKGSDLGKLVLQRSPGLTFGPPLPLRLFGHCIVNYNETFIYIIGGHLISVDKQPFPSNYVMTYDGILNEWSKIKTNEMPCPPMKFGYQTTCKLYV